MHHPVETPVRRVQVGVAFSSENNLAHSMQGLGSTQFQLCTLLIVCLSAAASAPPHWVKNAVFYQIFPDRFARVVSVKNLSF